MIRTRVNDCVLDFISLLIALTTTTLVALCGITYVMFSLMVSMSYSSYSLKLEFDLLLFYSW